MQAAARTRTILLPRRAILSFLVFVLGAFLALPALADHIGPHRTVSTWVWERLACHYEAVYDPPGAGWYGCTLDLVGPPDSTCDSTSSVRSYFNSAACGWPAGYSCETLPCDISRTSSIESCSDGDEGCRAVEKTVNQPPATVNGSVSCGLPGSGGWCRGGADLSVSGSEPLAGYNILALEGTRNGEAFACSGAACSVPLVEGGNSFTFWARSSYGDTSDMGSAAGSLDSIAPSVSGEVTGTPGDGGWYISDVILTASAGDPAPGAGLASLQVSVDGSGWAAYSGALTFSDGEHTVDLRAADAAGNTAGEAQSIRIDTLPPGIDLGAGASFCPGCTETLEISVEAQDAGSGVIGWTLSVDGSPIASGSGPISQTISWDGAGFGGGSHTLGLHARDLAGNTDETTLGVTVIVPTPEPEPPPGDSSSASSSESGGVEQPLASAPTAAPGPVLRPTRTPLTSTFGGLPAALRPGGGGNSSLADPPSIPVGELSGTVSGGSSGVLWGAAAIALAAGATAYGLDQARERKEKEAGLRLEMQIRNTAAQAREAAQRAALAAAVAAAAAAKAAQEIQERRKVLYRLAEYQDSLSRLEPPTTPVEQTVAWQSPDLDLNATYRLGRLYSSPQFASELSLPGGTQTPTPHIPMGTPTPLGTPDQLIPAQAPIAPYPPGYLPSDSDIFSLQGKWVGRGGSLLNSARRAYAASAVQYTALEAGKITVSAPSLVRGTRAEFLSDYYLRGGQYTRSTLSQVGLRQFTLRNLAAGARGTIGVGMITSLLSNLWDYTVGTQRETGVISKEFAVSTGVDLVLSVGTGLAAAGTVALIAAGLGIAAPVTATIAVTAVLGVGIGMLLDATGVGTALKRSVSEGLEAWPGILQNGQVIAQVVGERVGDLASRAAHSVVNTAIRAVDSVGTAAREVTQAVTTTAYRASEAARTLVERAASTIQGAAGDVVQAAQQIATTVQNTASQAIDSARQFLGSLFGGGK